MPSFQISGHLISRLPEVTGQSAKGQWVKREFVIETLDKDYPKKICFTAWGETVKSIEDFQKNDIIKLSFSAESRSHNSRWYTELRAFKIELADELPAPQPTAKAQGQRQPARQESRGEFQYSQEEAGSDDLPF